MKRHLFWLSLLPALLSLSSCATYNYAASATIGIKNLSGNATVDSQNLVAQNEDGLNVIFDVNNGRAILNNTSDQMITVDKATSYYTGTDGISQSFYSNSVTTVRTSNTSGASVNLGSVAGALGAGSVVTALASGVNVGNAKTTGTETQIYEQQYLSVPPFGSQILEMPEKFFYPFALNKNNKTMNQHFTPENNPLHSTFIFSYAKDGDTKFKMERDYLYLSDVTAQLVEPGFQYADAPNRKNFIYKDTNGAVLLGCGLGIGGLGLLLTSVGAPLKDESPVLLALGITYTVLGVALAIPGAILSLSPAGAMFKVYL